jgi:hypothetical protein
VFGNVYFGHSGINKGIKICGKLVKMPLFSKKNLIKNHAINFSKMDATAKPGECL